MYGIYGYLLPIVEGQADDDKDEEDDDKDGDDGGGLVHAELLQVVHGQVDLVVAAVCRHVVLILELVVPKPHFVEQLLFIHRALHTTTTNKGLETGRKVTHS